IVDRALVTARTDAGIVLTEIDARHPSIEYDTDDWLTPAFDTTATATARLDTPTIRRVGSVGWYLDRLGFWHGACRPAAGRPGRVLGRRRTRPDRPGSRGSRRQGRGAAPRRTRRRAGCDRLGARYGARPGR